tara:strand:- start:1763 stop:2098 length:336 start_codon:yes stop_codon:yes gene_type:complete
MATFSYTPSFTATENSRPEAQIIKLGDSYEHRISFGLQRDPKSWRLSFANRDDTERDNIITFLEDKKGTESFDWTPPRGSAGKWVCSDWSLDIAVAGRTTINTTFREVFEP